MEPVEYQPWAMILNMVVPVDGWDEFSHMRIPYVAAADVNSLLKVGEITAHLSLTKMMEMTAAAHAPTSVQVIAQMQASKYDPPYIRFRCPECKYEWDAWVDENGFLEDKYSVMCTNGDCPHKGEPASLIQEDV